MKISILIPVYNVENYVARCLNSILVQSFQDFEIIIVDDCSPDASMSIVAKYAEKDERIKIFHNERNRGLMYTRKVAYTQAKGEYVVFLDSDDYLPEGALQYLYEGIQSSNYDLVIGNYQLVTYKGDICLNNYQFKYGTDKLAIFKSLLLREVPHNLFAKIYKRSLFVENEYNTIDNLVNGEDAALFYQIIDTNPRIGLIDKNVYSYVQNRASASNMRYSAKQIEQIFCALNIVSFVISKYPMLNICLTKKICHLLLSFKLKGYKKLDLFTVCNKYGFVEYFSFSKIKDAYSFGQAVFIYFVINFVSIRILNRN